MGPLVGLFLKALLNDHNSITICAEKKKIPVIS